MDDKLKTRIRYTSTIDADLVETLKDMSQKTRIPQSKLLDEALEDLFKKMKIRIKKSKKKSELNTDKE